MEQVALEVNRIEAKIGEDLPKASQIDFEPH